MTTLVDSLVRRDEYCHEAFESDVDREVGVDIAECIDLRAGPTLTVEETAQLAEAHD